MSEKPDAFELAGREICYKWRVVGATMDNLLPILREHFPDVPRVLDWLRSSPRKPAHLAFTAGPDRELAAELEWELRYEQYTGGKDDAAAEEFCEWLSDRLPDLVFPSKEVALLDVKEALISILRKHYQPPASEPAPVQAKDTLTESDPVGWYLCGSL